MTTICETSRLRLREVTVPDAAFICELMNEPAYLAHIGDRGVRTAADAERYIVEKFIGSYQRNGYGLYLVETRDDGAPVGICGLVKREALPHPDVGFAYLQRFWGRGYGVEAGAAVVELAQARFAVAVLYAVVAPANARSIRLVEKLGLSWHGTLKMPGQEEEGLLFQRVFST